MCVECCIFLYFFFCLLYRSRPMLKSFKQNELWYRWSCSCECINVVTVALCDLFLTQTTFYNEVFPGEPLFLLPTLFFLLERQKERCTNTTEVWVKKEGCPHMRHLSNIGFLSIRLFSFLSFFLFSYNHQIFLLCYKNLYDCDIFIS